MQLGIALLALGITANTARAVPVRACGVGVDPHTTYLTCERGGHIGDLSALRRLPYLTSLSLPRAQLQGGMLQVLAALPRCHIDR